VVSPEVIPLDAGGKRYRMYYEGASAAGSSGRAAGSAGVTSALSVDGGMTFQPEPGWRLTAGGAYFFAPRVLHLPESAGGGFRMYASQGDLGIVSARSMDGLSFELEPGVCVHTGHRHAELSCFAPEVVAVGDGSFGGGPPAHYRMVYAGVPDKDSAFVLSAISADGREWSLDPTPVVAPGGRFDRVKASEMCLMQLPAKLPGDEPPRYRVLYEGW
jgi:hypothetical protein